jgi:hypothetical protein
MGKFVKCIDGALRTSLLRETSESTGVFFLPLLQGGGPRQLLTPSCFPLHLVSKWSHECRSDLCLCHEELGVCVGGVFKSVVSLP